jgi:DNA-binding NarL/FixJ family response regulator
MSGAAVRGDAGRVATASTPTVVIADDDIGVRRALSELITAHPDLSLAGVAASGPEAAALCGLHRPTVAVVDVMMPGGGRDAIMAIREVSPHTLIVVYTARSDRRTAERMREAGAQSVIVKGGGKDVASELIGVALRGSALELDAGAVDG